MGHATLASRAPITDLIGRIFTIHARTRTAEGTEFARSAVVRFSDGAAGRFWSQDWRDES